VAVPLQRLIVDFTRHRARQPQAGLQ